MTQVTAGHAHHPAQPKNDAFKTVCGRTLTVGRMRLEGMASQVARVTLDIDDEGLGDEEIWASLTPAEARNLAGRLLVHAAAAEREAAAATEHSGAASAAQSGRINVEHVAGDSYAVAVRTHALLVDQPVEAGGEDTAPMPTELFTASLASCVAYAAGRYLSRHGYSREGLRVHAEYTMASDRPARVTTIRLRLMTPADLPDDRRAALTTLASHCTVQNTLQQAPEICIDLD